MSQKIIKAQRKIEKEKEADYNLRVTELSKELQALSMKYKIDLVGGIQYRQTALVPVILYVDVKEKYEAMAAEAKRLEEEKQKGIKVKQPENTVAPKLEV
jgi:hypothetical protein